MGGNWNVADKTLLGALLLFLSTLFWHCGHSDNLWAEGLLFTAEAALVGGVADWFAVTALFRKPLGFPYHTAILPKKREEFSAAMVRLIQQEFFSRRHLFALMNTYNWKDWLWEGLKTDVFRAEIRKGLRAFLQNAIGHFDSHKVAETLALRFQARLHCISFTDVLSYFNRWLQKDDHDRRLLGTLSLFLREKAERTEFYTGIENMLRDMQRQKIEESGVLGMLFSSLSETMDIVNVGDLAKIIQNEIVAFAEQIGEQNSEVQERFLTLFHDRLATCEQDEVLRDSYMNFRDALADHLPINQEMTMILRQIQSALTDSFSPAGTALSASLLTFMEAIVTRAMDMLRDDTAVGKKFDVLVYDIVARSTLQAQAISGIVAREVMGRMTDEQLNRIVYDKIESDMLWIRMNGTVMGAVIGSMLFFLRLVLGYGGS